MENLKRFVARVLPGLDPEPAVVETCMYTVGVACVPTLRPMVSAPLI